MPKGFNTMIGKTGRGLSGGQKQRMLIARTLYCNPRFLFLYEVTNALNAINEQKIVEALKSASVGRTIVIIAHRLSTIHHAGQIIVMDRGFNQELMEKNGLLYFTHFITNTNTEIIKLINISTMKTEANHHKTGVHYGQEARRKVEESGITIAEFARRIHCSRNNAYNIFNREYIDIRLLLTISDVLYYDFIHKL
jgi:ABC-type multidrug transport system ATPase subunit